MNPVNAPRMARARSGCAAARSMNASATRTSARLSSSCGRYSAAIAYSTLTGSGGSAEPARSRIRWVNRWCTLSASQCSSA